MTLSEQAYANLRNDIVRGTFRPDSPLRLAELSERYQVHGSVEGVGLAIARGKGWL